MVTQQSNPCSVEALARACAQQASRQGTPAVEPDPCYELFRRAFDLPPDDSAWQAVLSQYHRLISYWLGQYGSEDTVQEVFVRFWKAQRAAAFSFTARFPNIGAVMGYLKRCALTVRFEAGREEERWRALQERLCDAMLVETILGHVVPDRSHEDFDYRPIVLARLADEREQAVFELAYRCDLAPREIQAERPDLFPDVRAVYRVKENLLKRLRRDPDLRQWWARCQRHTGEHGGNAAGSPV